MESTIFLYFDNRENGRFCYLIQFRFALNVFRKILVIECIIYFIFERFYEIIFCYCQQTLQSQLAGSMNVLKIKSSLLSVKL